MNDKICVKGALRDDKDRQPSERSAHQQSAQQQQRSPGRAMTPDSHPPERNTKRQKNSETLTRNLSDISLSRLVDAYIRRNISKPRMAKRDPDYGESRSSRRLSVEKFSEVTDDTDALFV